MRKSITRALRGLERFVRKLSSRNAASLDPVVRDVLTAGANGLRFLLDALRTASAQL